jgi:hypothetical protein
MGTSVDGLPGTTTCAQFASDPFAARSLITYKPKFAASTQTAFLMMFVNCDTFPATDATLFYWYLTGGTVARVACTLGAGGSWKFDLFGFDGNTLSTGTYSFGTPSTDPSMGWVGVNVLLTASAGTVSWSVRWLPLATSSTSFSGVGPTTFSGSVGSSTLLKSMNYFGTTGIAGLREAQVFLGNVDVGFVTTSVLQAATAYYGETAGARLDRLANENGIPLEIVGLRAQTAVMGYQVPDTFVNLIEDCADADGGILAECRDINSIRYVTLLAMTSRIDAAVPYTSLTAAPLPTEDNTGFFNSITATTPGGSSAVSTRTTTGYHHLGTDMAGFVAGPGISPNVATTAELADAASWATGAGSFDVPRVPTLTTELRKPSLASLLAAISALDVGSSVAVTSMNLAPTAVPPDDLREIVRGYTETLTRSLWTPVLNTTPAGQFRVAHYNEDDAWGTPRYDTSGSTLSTAVNSSATTLVLAYANAGDNWTVTAGSYPFNIIMGGEVITLTAAPAGAASPQTFTGVTRSVNGIVKAHVVGEAVTLADDGRNYYGK